MKVQQQRRFRTQQLTPAPVVIGLLSIMFVAHTTVFLTMSLPAARRPAPGDVVLRTHRFACLAPCVSGQFSCLLLFAALVVQSIYILR
jgi:hypothetical protein